MKGNRIVGLRISLPLVFFMLAGCMAQTPLNAYPGGEAKVHEIESMAKQGNVMAQVKLGEMYEFGNGEPQDYGKAETLYQQAADKGDMCRGRYTWQITCSCTVRITWAPSSGTARPWIRRQRHSRGGSLVRLYYYCLGVPCHLPETQTFYEKAMASQAGQEEVFNMAVQTELMRTRNTEDTTKGQTIFGTAVVEFDYDSSGAPINVKIKEIQWKSRYRCCHHQGGIGHQGVPAFIVAGNISSSLRVPGFELCSPDISRADDDQGTGLKCVFVRFSRAWRLPAHRVDVGRRDFFLRQCAYHADWLNGWGYPWLERSCSSSS